MPRTRWVRGLDAVQMLDRSIRCPETWAKRRLAHSQNPLVFAPYHDASWRDPRRQMTDHDALERGRPCDGLLYFDDARPVVDV
jgi:hypothetical protein